MASLLSAEVPDLTAWGEFLDEAGGSELAEIGSSLAGRPPLERGELVRLLAPFAKSPDWNLRDSIARVFGAMGDRHAEPSLRQLLFGDEEPLVRYSALKALTSLGVELNSSEIDNLLEDSSPLVKEDLLESRSVILQSAQAKKDRSERLRKVSRLLKYLSDPTRLEIVLLLNDREWNVADLSSELGQEPGSFSHHLALLRDGDLISPRRQGKSNYYSLTEMGYRLSSLIMLMINPSVAGGSSLRQSGRNPVTRS